MGRSHSYVTNSILEKWELKPLVLSDACDFSPSINILRNPAKLERWVSHLVLPLYCHTYQPPENVSGSFHDLFKEFPPGHLCWPMTAFRHHPQAYSACFGYSTFYLLLLFDHSVMSGSLQPHGLLHTRLPCSSLSPAVCLNSCPLNWSCHPTISSSVVPFTSCLQSSQH